MRTLVCIALATLVAAEAASGQCLGDFNGNFQVEINEIIVSVNNALNGCERSCPIDFSDDNTQVGTPDCYYRGRWNHSCGDDQLETLWRSDAEIVILTFTQLDSVDCGGSVVSATEVQLIGCFLGPSEDDFVEASGPIRLEDGGATLTMLPDPSPFMVDGCPLERYAGTLTRVIAPSLQRGAVTGGRERARSLLDRFRAERAARRALPPAVDFSRR